MRAHATTASVTLKSQLLYSLMLCFGFIARFFQAVDKNIGHVYLYLGGFLMVLAGLFHLALAADSTGAAFDFTAESFGTLDRLDMWMKKTRK